jgi:7-cyano-7-deazaguanine synthase
MDPLAVLISGGLDSAILLGIALGKQSAIYPLYVRCGLFWEVAELAHLHRYLQAVACPALQPLNILDQPVIDLYGGHWSITGNGVPDASSSDEAVYLPGRNLLLLSKALLWCHLKQLPALALGSLGTNSFPDASPAFFQAMEDLVSRGVQGSVALRCPFAGMNKSAVMRLGNDLPLHYSFSCINPQAGRHCGACNKCAERQHAFADAGMIDPTEYSLDRRV